MNYKLKLTLAVLATVLVFVLITCGALMPHLLNKDKDPAETTTGEDMNMTTPEETTGADTTVADTTIPDTTIPDTTVPEPTEVIYHEENDIILWDDLTDHYELVDGQYIQLMITNNTSTDVVVELADMRVNGSEYILGDNMSFDDLIVSAGSVSLIRIDFSTEIEEAAIGFIVSPIIDDEIGEPLFDDDGVVTLVFEQVVC
jgi:hypothetical protein